MTQLRVDGALQSDFTASMRIVTLIPALALLLLAAGCAQPKATYPPDSYAPRPSIATTPSPGASTSASASVTNRNLIITLDPSATGKVARVNPSDRFVVLNFPLGHMPSLEQRLSLYRKGLKIGEVKITGPQQDDNMVADLVTGEADVGDEVRLK
jgi:hypothetical protein